VRAVNAATCQVLSTRSLVDDGHRLASYDTSLVVSGGVDCGRRRRNVYDKKPRRYAKDNRTAHLTARSDKSIAYVTDKKKTIRCFALLKLSTDRHEASRGLFATAELLVIAGCRKPYRLFFATFLSNGKRLRCGALRCGISAY